MLLENNIQQALAQQSIELEDAIDVRDIKNVKLANQLLKLRRRKKIQNDQLIQQQNMQAQAQANMQTQQAAAQSEVQKQSAISQAQGQLETLKAELDAQRLVQEAEIKKQLMQLEFEYNMQIKGIEVDNVKKRESQKEDRKDERTRIQAQQQSELIEQRKSGSAPKSFESAGNDIITGDFDLGVYDPK